MGNEYFNNSVGGEERLLKSTLNVICLSMLRRALLINSFHYMRTHIQHERSLASIVVSTYTSAYMAFVLVFGSTCTIRQQNKCNLLNILLIFSK